MSDFEELEDMSNEELERRLLNYSGQSLEGKDVDTLMREAMELAALEIERQARLGACCDKAKGILNPHEYAQFLVQVGMTEQEADACIDILKRKTSGEPVESLREKIYKYALANFNQKLGGRDGYPGSN